MKIKRIELTNFRQFKGKNELIFSTDDDKNVTFIMAENSSGKTTIIEAFRFLFFGNTSIGDGIVNMDLKREMPIGEDLEIKVVAEILYREREYSLTRKSIYKKNTNKINFIVSTLVIEYKDDNGVTKKLFENDAKDFIKEIMPENLFNYFFFEGEEIENLGESLFAKTKKQNAFAEAIKNLLGFTYLYRMKDDLEKVIKTFNKDLEAAYDNDKDNKKLQLEINKCMEEKENNEQSLKSYEDELEKLKNEKDNVSKILLQNTSTKEKQNERNKLKREIDKIDNELKRIKQKMFNDFSKYGWYLFASKLSNRALETLKSEDQIDKGVPGLNASCIKYIIENHKCICGAEIQKGTKAYDHLIELENFIPPISIGTQISQFKSKILDISSNCDMVYENIQDGRIKLNEYRIEYEKIEKKIDELDSLLKDTTDMSQYVSLQKDIETNIGETERKIGAFKEKINYCVNSINEKEKQKTKIKSNERVDYLNGCIYYTKRSFNATERFIEKNEVEMKQKLEQKINEVFVKVFNVDYTIKLEEDYSLKIENDGVNITNEVKFGGAQDTIIAFAFIGAIIELSKSQIDLKKKSNEKNVEFDNSAEPYPLVLDAPSSTFDIKRIEDFCKYIPQLAEQTIILIKDTDGKYVEGELKEKIGKRYKFNKLNDWETIIEEK